MQSGVIVVFKTCFDFCGCSGWHFRNQFQVLYNCVLISAIKLASVCLWPSLVIENDLWVVAPL